ncbi:uncharacterized protein BDW47DRAFT_9053 [Aspergillus candidus]|uniref:Uncharacterized protein n=1 Tax=Aspergillus candidus TaxID=41067 RepID=A0A2I2FGW8_ASPCN|nr:hypothetical protein BDW47DRAFT_9053 [Aspergillus candidus]PLB39876.1 hypothetical protein BDW47DRAFT_9053 [Aspergillus candidus]
MKTRKILCVGRLCTPADMLANCIPHYSIIMDRKRAVYIRNQSPLLATEQKLDRIIPEISLFESGHEHDFQETAPARLGLWKREVRSNTHDRSIELTALGVIIPSIPCIFYYVFRTPYKRNIQHHLVRSRLWLAEINDYLHGVPRIPLPTRVDGLISHRDISSAQVISDHLQISQ